MRHLHRDRPLRSDDYTAWHAGAQWDADGNPDEDVIHKIGLAPEPETREERTLRLINAAGLIHPLMELAGEPDEGRFVQRAIESGTWDGMLRLVELAKTA